MDKWSLKIIKASGNYKLKYSLVIIFKQNGLTEVIDLLNTEGMVTINNGEYALVYSLEV